MEAPSQQVMGEVMLEILVSKVKPEYGCHKHGEVNRACKVSRHSFLHEAMYAKQYDEQQEDGNSTLPPYLGEVVAFVQESDAHLGYPP